MLFDLVLTELGVVISAVWKFWSFLANCVAAARAPAMAALKFKDFSPLQQMILIQGSAQRGIQASRKTDLLDLEW